MTDVLLALVEAIREFGPAAVIMAGLLTVNGFFLYRDWRREERQQKQIDALNQQMRDTIVPLMTECREAITTCKDVIKQNSQIIVELAGRGTRK